jgi:hypothetical protein
MAKALEDKAGGSMRTVGTVQLSCVSAACTAMQFASRSSHQTHQKGQERQRGKNS